MANRGLRGGGGARGGVLLLWVLCLTWSWNTCPVVGSVSVREDMSGGVTGSKSRRLSESMRGSMAGGGSESVIGSGSGSVGVRGTLLHKSLASISFDVSRTLQRLKRLQSVEPLDTPPLTHPPLTHPSLTPPSLPHPSLPHPPLTQRRIKWGSGDRQGEGEGGEGGGEGRKGEKVAVLGRRPGSMSLRSSTAQATPQQQILLPQERQPERGPLQQPQQPQQQQQQQQETGPPLQPQQEQQQLPAGQAQQPGGGNRTSSTCTYRVGPTFPLKTIQAALDAVGQNKISNPVAICVSAGVYPEYLRVKPGQDNIRLIGQGPNTIITGNRSLGQVKNTFLAATLIVEGELFIARNIRIQNSYYSVSDPAPAVAILSHTTRWYNSTVEAWGDTVAIYRGANHLFSRCTIAGVTDMTWGFGRAAFVDTTFYVRRFVQNGTRYSGNIATFGTGPSSEGVTAGAILWNCTIDGPGTTYLGRPYRPETITVFAHCYLGKAVLADGWNAFRHNLDAKQYQFVEYDSRGPGAARLRKYGQVYQEEPPTKFTVTAFLQRQ